MAQESIMRCFLKGVLGAVLVLVLAAMAIPQYADYRARAETDMLLGQLHAVQQRIEAVASEQKSFLGVAKGIAKPAFSRIEVTVFEITQSGAIIVKGGRDGQMLVLSPSFDAEKITWHCVGGPTKDMPAKCRG
jgi:type II secretory pathway pseudopilin PulG